MDNREICRMSATEMRKAIGVKKLSPVEIMDVVLARIEAINPKINAYCTVVAESARKEAKKAEKKVMKKEPLGKLHGVPVSIKDLVFTKGIKTTGGSKMYENFVPEQDAIVVERLKNAGAIVIGKTNTPESGWVATTNNPLFGVTRNPWNVKKTSGGSSGGAASAMAACLVPIAIGSDGGGSIRIPSSFCGVFGLKPSFGRVPQWPGFPGLWEGLSVTGPITRTVRDAALMMEVIAGYDERDMYAVPQTPPHYQTALRGDLKGMRVAWSSNLGYAIVDKRVLKVTESAVKVFTTLGCEVESAHPDVGSPEAAFSTQIAGAMCASLYDKLGTWGKYFDPNLARYVAASIDIKAMDYVKARMNHLEYWNKMRGFFEKYDLLLTPTLAVPAFDVPYYGPKEINGQKVPPMAWMPFTYPFNITGQPAASVPCGFTDDGLPIGLQIIGRKYDEASVLRAAAAFEKARPWAKKYPPLD
ncbi:MAG: amidase [Dehalococcoidales bacterium]|nr:amidase [Dehalococcoidales bacterium]